MDFKRRRRPGLVEIDPVTIASGGRLATMRVRPPKLGYPEAVFAAGSSARAALLAQIAANDLDPPNAKPPGIRDPDTSYLSFRVLVRTPTFDPVGDEAGFVTWYTTIRSFPSDVEAPLDLALTWVDCARLDDLSAQAGADGTVTGPLQVPTVRDVRIEVRALGRGNLTYFANDDARQGATDSVNLHAVAATAAEVGLLATLPPSDALRSVFLRPDPIGARAAARPAVAQNDPTPVLLARLADASDLVADGSLLVGQPSERMAFGCAGLAHHLAPDSTSLELAESGELAGQWIHVVQAMIDRYWTWRGPGSPTARVIRTVSFPTLPSVAPVDTEVGTIELMPTINVQARKNPEREYTRLAFLDALRPPLGPDGLPFEVAIAYCVLRGGWLEGGGKVETRIDSVLPIVTPPRQVPRVVAAGLALTPYVHDEDYDRTAPRSKRLWLEFAAPLADPRDAYFVRALTRCPDPMLLPASEPLPDPDVVKTIPIDPDLVRVITPGQVQDLAGLASVQKLEPAADSDRRFLVPLPPNTDPNSPERFSFFTYEVRVGHDRGPAKDPLWSTAQGRFGEPLVLEGVHHPAPELACSAMSGALGSPWNFLRSRTTPVALVMMSKTLSSTSHF